MSGIKWKFWKDGDAASPLEKVEEEILTDSFLEKEDTLRLNFEIDTIQNRITKAVESATDRKLKTAELLEPNRDHYIIEAINLLILSDIMQKRNNTDDLLLFTSKDEELQAILDDFKAKTDWEQLITDILPDLLFAGEYHLRLSDDGYVEDDVPQGALLTAYRHGMVHTHYAKKKESTGTTGESIYKEIEPRAFAHFSLNSFRERIDLDAKGLHATEKVPTSIRVGTSYYKPIAHKLTSLSDSETTLDAAQLNNLSSDNVVGIEMPANTTPSAALRITARYQSMLNASKTALTQSGQLSVAKVISALGQIKVLPIYTGGKGSGKGSLSKLDIKNDRTTDDILTSIKDKRDLILGTLGIPSGILFSGIDDSQNSNTLKRYSRYAKTITIIQNGILQGIRQLVYAYVAKRTTKEFNAKDLSVSFFYLQPDLSSLDHLEIISTSLASLQSLDEYLAKLSKDEDLQGLVTPEIRAEVITKNVGLIIGKDLIKQGVFKPTKKEAFADIEVTEEDIDSIFPEIATKEVE